MSGYLPEDASIKELEMNLRINKIHHFTRYSDGTLKMNPEYVQIMEDLYSRKYRYPSKSE